MRGQRNGFTLVELLIVVVIIGVLAAVAILQTRRANEAAYRASMEADLRHLAVQQEIYHQINMRYADVPELVDFATTPGVSILVTWLDPAGFAATATHAALPSMKCGYFVGAAPAGAADPAFQEADIHCN